VASGFCQAAPHALRNPCRNVCARLVSTLSSFFKCLPEDSHPAATAVLVVGGGVELTMGHMADAELDEVSTAVGLFIHFASDPLARERLCAGEVPDQILKWMAKVLPQVRGVG
jgi:hypothetical protein